jgi:hypothetical protein
MKHAMWEKDKQEPKRKQVVEKTPKHDRSENKEMERERKMILGR